MTREILENEKRRRSADDGEKHADGKSVKDHVADAEKRAVDHDNTGGPVGEIGTEVADLRFVRAEFGNGSPTINAGMDAAIKRDEFLLRLWFCDERADHPENCSDCGGEKCGFCSDHGAVAGKFHVGENEGKNGGADGGDDFAPRIDAPPIPAKDQNGARARADAENDGPPGGNGNELAGNPAAAENEEDSKNLADVDVVLFGGIFDEEAAVEIVHQIGSTPVELRADGGHERCEKRRDHQSDR